MIRKIILPGGSGFLGRTLARWFEERGAEVIILTRSPKPVPHGKQVYWDGKTRGPWTETLEGADAVINLAGRSVNCRYHRRNRAAMMDSRVDSTHVLGDAIAACKNSPKVWIQSSTATIYKHTYGPVHDETGPIGSHPDAKDAFSIEVATNWEKAFEDKPTPCTRRLIMRTAMVFGDEPGGVYQVLRRLVRFGLGGDMHHGRQYMSWLHAEDFCRIMEWMITNERAEGIYNVAAPHPLSNREMMKIFRKVERVPIGLPAFLWQLELGAFFLRTETELIIKSRRVVPKRLLDEGFEFNYPGVEDALKALRESSCARVPQEGIKFRGRAWWTW
jgi:uncharacterized protein (TIGR01777 family)